MPSLNCMPCCNLAFISLFIHSRLHAGPCCNTLLLSVTSCSFPALHYIISLPLWLQNLPCSPSCASPQELHSEITPGWAEGSEGSPPQTEPSGWKMGEIAKAFEAGWAQPCLPELLPRTVPVWVLKQATAACQLSYAQQNKPGCLGHRFNWFCFVFCLVPEVSLINPISHFPCKLY